MSNICPGQPTKYFIYNYIDDQISQMHISRNLLRGCQSGSPKDHQDDQGKYLKPKKKVGWSLNLFGLILTRIAMHNAKNTRGKFETLTLGHWRRRSWKNNLSKLAPSRKASIRHDRYANPNYTLWRFDPGNTAVVAEWFHHMGAWMHAQISHNLFI